MRYQAGITGLMLLSLTHSGFALDETGIRVIIKYKQATSPSSLKKQLKQTTNLSPTTLKPIAGGAYVLTFDSQARPKGIKNSDSTEAVLATLRQNPNVVYAVKDRIGHFIAPPQLQLTESSILVSHEAQWDEFAAPGGIMLESVAGFRDGAWSYTSGQAPQPIVVAVLDTGIAAHPSLINNLIKDEQGNFLGWNFAANNADTFDETGTFHGTHVAGTIAAYGNVMLGVGEHLKILPVKIPDSSGMFYESQVINAIYWSVGGDIPGVPKNPYPAKVLNMSFGVDERPGKEVEHCDLALQEALDFVRSKGAVITVAAGNENKLENYSAPAVCQYALKIAATGPTGFRAYYSNYGPSISFAAPGGDLFYGKQGGILSTVNPGGGYQYSGFDFYQGTSMAAPHAAGVVGLIYAVSKDSVSVEQVEKILVATTHAFGQNKDNSNSCVSNKSCGTGILDANNAVRAAIADYDDIFIIPATCDTLEQGKSKWFHVKGLCQDKTDLTPPQLSQTEQGKIELRYGQVTYRLDDSAFTLCEIIGVRGLGCYS
ncbi:Extracellular basic protease precursor [Legionella massiliensis]|uniref:Extracellular basic protease n=1 Tax=Legionella massiliensis TaxID=1034943 RepID=A0A078L0V8_9GAMM|nr:S8 family serine peptidase [Legionella massiliensis]CDZ77678.1 Extracellular basic protease precursor [Legionella massiliensis]CEE13416.1 Extracellular basic protease precursor [Legionella massiliensis]